MDLLRVLWVLWVLGYDDVLAAFVSTLGGAARVSLSNTFVLSEENAPPSRSGAGGGGSAAIQESVLSADATSNAEQRLGSRTFRWWPRRSADVIPHHRNLDLVSAARAFYGRHEGRLARHARHDCGIPPSGLQYVIATIVFAVLSLAFLVSWRTLWSRSSDDL